MSDKPPTNPPRPPGGLEALLGLLFVAAIAVGAATFLPEVGRAIAAGAAIVLVLVAMILAAVRE